VDPKPRSPLARLRASARNALEIARFGGLATEPYSAPYDVVDEGPHHKLRRYASETKQDDAPVALLVPPLMVTAEVYDVAQDVSAVAALAARGVRVFVSDFGAPERIAGGMRRTLDDHVRAVVRSIERAREITGRDVHVCGYSQGGMFAYQAAAYLRSEGVKSVVTFGSPVDIHRNLPNVRSDVMGALARVVEPALSKAIDSVEGMPGFLSSTVFKMLSPRKELEQRIDFVRSLHDRNALVRREARRKFLGGQGFVAWPGPALRAFVEDFIVHNRMLSGGFVIDGRTIALADIRCPILCFIGDADEIARADSVRAIREAAPDADVRFCHVPAGHFGLVVGSRALAVTWPTVSEWIRWNDAGGLPPANLTLDADDSAGEGTIDDVRDQAELLFDTVKDGVRAAWKRLGDITESATDALDAVRYQEPRLRKLEGLTPDDRISPSRALAEQARRDPEQTFFLWHGRAFSYRDADERVTNVVRGLYACGVRAGDRVAVVMGSRPSFLSVVTALGRLGAIAVIAAPETPDERLRAAIERADVKHVVSDPELGERCLGLTRGDVLVLGGGGGARKLPRGLVDMEAIDPNAVALPKDFPLDPGRAKDLAMILLRPSESGELRAAAVTNHRWALSALGAASACTIRPADTVYCCVPLHHPTAILVSVGSAITGGARLALADGFDAARFASDVRRTGATVVFYAGEMLRPLLFEPPSRGDRTLPVRRFAGSGMRKALAARLFDRFGVGVMEFFGSTTQNVILANALGTKPGSLGRLLPGSANVALVRCDLVTGRPIRGAHGRLEDAGVDEPGLLVVQLATTDEIGPNVIEGAFSPGDRWYVTSDVLSRDQDGDFWFVDSRNGFVATPGGAVSTRKVEDALYAMPEIELAAAWGDGGAIVAAYTSREAVSDARIAEAMAELALHERPKRVMRVTEVPMTDGFRAKKSELARIVGRR
jgi:putative long chain acyl-CoA synthase